MKMTVTKCNSCGKETSRSLEIRFPDGATHMDICEICARKILTDHFETEYNKSKKSDKK